MQGFLSTLLLPPNLLLLLGVALGILAWRGRRWAGIGAAAACAGVLLLSTPLIAEALLRSLTGDLRPRLGAATAGAIIILGGDVAHGRDGTEVGALTLERLRTGAALHRRTGLPILVTGGILGPRQPPIARLMAESLRTDFGVEARWIEAEAKDTRENAVFSARMLRSDGIGSALVVSQGWHLPRALEAFGRLGFDASPAPVRLEAEPDFVATDIIPRVDHLVESWYAIREWMGRGVYRLRDGGTVAGHGE
jgi:uncharacterized SAM-binding protein YcdF (DUF218 family)